MDLIKLLDSDQLKKSGLGEIKRLYEVIDV